jgi:hypothetical protein
MFVGLDVAIGLALVFSLVSLMSSTVQEWIAALLNFRGKKLWMGIERLLGPALKEVVCKNQLVAGLAKRKGGKPSYVDAGTFVAALLDSLGGSGGNSPTTAGGVRSLVANLPAGKERDALLALVDAGQNDLDKVKTNITQWYDAAMDRVSGWYKRQTQLWLFGISLVIAATVGVDSIKITEALYSNPQLRASLVESATKLTSSKPAAGQPAPAPVQEGNVEAGNAPAGSKTKDDQAVQKAVQDLKDETARLQKTRADLEKARAGFEALGVPTASFNDFKSDKANNEKGFWDWFGAHVLGFLLTAIAASLGAPFWFDLLNRFVNLRSSGAKPAPTSTSG